MCTDKPELGLRKCGQETGELGGEGYRAVSRGIEGYREFNGVNTLELGLFIFLVGRVLYWTECKSKRRSLAKLVTLDHKWAQQLLRIKWSTERFSGDSQMILRWFSDDSQNSISEHRAVAAKCENARKSASAIVKNKTQATLNSIHGGFAMNTLHTAIESLQESLQKSLLDSVRSLIAGESQEKSSQTALDLVDGFNRMT